MVSQTPTTAQLVKQSQVSCLVFGLLFFLCIIPALVYLVNSKDSQVYLEVDESGRVSRRS